MIGPKPERVQKSNSKKGCAVFAKAGDLEACGNGVDLSVSRGGKPIGHIQTDQCPVDDHGTLGKCDAAILSLEWSQDAKWLLVAALEDVHESDYYVVNSATMKAIRVAGAPQDAALWIPGRDEVLYTTTETLAPLPDSRGRHSVSVQHLIRFDPTQPGKSTAITSGLTDNFDVSLCGQ